MVSLFCPLLGMILFVSRQRHKVIHKSTVSIWNSRQPNLDIEVSSFNRPLNVSRIISTEKISFLYFQFNKQKH